MDCRMGVVMVSSWMLLMTSAVTSVGAGPVLGAELDGLESQVRQVRQVRRPGLTGHELAPWKIREPVRPSARLILIILTEKCRRLREQGVSPLPSYCWILGNASSVQSLNRGYDHYEESVPNTERLHDLQTVQIDNNQHSDNRVSIGGPNDVHRAV
ncbi:uncharacterized protein [Littorina saxatilis]|uniref:Uncharacterized protein n=1 Tax=Littorina saxatilis TaxID=31220 RepID=A0AAN9FYA3_9CAEN